MSDRPQGSGTGIFGLLFREVGLFYEQAFKWADDQVKGTLTLDPEERLLEQVRQAKEAGVDVEKVMAKLRKGK
ncbi:hypothetical protein EKD04_017760 [Chloroflexales bacterium ZM16-3]|nr:hypothetical protein [Chloroflexales bacterium ZM16-3]